MALTELTTGLRCIEDAAPEIAPGMVPGCGDHASGKTPPFEVMSLSRGQIVSRERQWVLNSVRTGPPESHCRPLALKGIQGVGLQPALGLQVTWDRASARTRAQRRSHVPRVRVDEVRSHDSH